MHPCIRIFSFEQSAIIDFFNFIKLFTKLSKKRRKRSFRPDNNIKHARFFPLFFFLHHHRRRRRRRRHRSRVFFLETE